MQSQASGSLPSPTRVPYNEGHWRMSIIIIGQAASGDKSSFIVQLDAIFLRTRTLGVLDGIALIEKKKIVARRTYYMYV